MAVKLPEIIKVAKEYTIAGLVLISAWLLLVPTYVSFREDQRSASHLAAFLLLRDAIGSKTAYFYGNDGNWRPEIPHGVSLMRDLGEDGAVATCTTIPHDEPVAGRRAGVFQTDCDPISVPSLDKTNRRLLLNFRRVEIPILDKRVIGYYKVEAAHTELPFGAYRIVLVAKHPELEPGSETIPISPAPVPAASESDGAAAEVVADATKDVRMYVTTPAAPAASQNEAATAINPTSKQDGDTFMRPIEVERMKFTDRYELFVVRSAVAETFLKPAGDEESNIVDSLWRATYGTEPAYIEARQPSGWGRTRELVRTPTGDIPELVNLKIGDPAVQKLVQDHIYQEGVYDIAGIKVEMSKAPWAAAALLTVITCLLVGKFAALRRATPEDLTEDFGWLLLQPRGQLQPSVVIATAVLVIVLLGVVGVAATSTLTALNALDSKPRASLITLLVTMLAFTTISGLIVLQQLRLSYRLFEIRKKGPSSLRY